MSLRPRSLLAISSLLLLSLAAAAQEPPPNMVPGPFPDLRLVPRPKPADPKTFPRLNDKPDLTGIWSTGIRAFQSLTDREINPPLTADYVAKRKEWRAASEAGKPFADTVSRCEAFGMARVMTMSPLEFISSKNQLTIISQDLHEVRRVYLDGRPHPKDAEPTYSGHSTGHWEGNTLVIDTVGIIATNLSLDGIWLSDKAHIVERLNMVNPDGLINEMTITDPEALTKPWVTYHYYVRMPKGTEMEEYICTNNRQTEGPNGELKPRIDQAPTP